MAMRIAALRWTGGQTLSWCAAYSYKSGLCDNFFLFDTLTIPAGQLARTLFPSSSAPKYHKPCSGGLQESRFFFQYPYQCGIFVIDIFPRILKLRKPA
ncbi:hypothetical protein EV421DRAFT_1131994 [Armillaria borealis]|uniref:Uncharacterized protein n=1 Tax=Armillaria borealis TaxID=47425 RepID=A0AA39MJR3_9AGAR|nr:hypothetical protein EV421DRAFT_1131994 [Armillaria borealis]